MLHSNWLKLLLQENKIIFSKTETRVIFIKVHFSDTMITMWKTTYGEVVDVVIEVL